MTTLISNKKTIFAWCLYDVASSAFPIIITTFIFATYFTSHVAANKIVGTVQWADATALAGVIIAITSPIFGAIADHRGHHKHWLAGFTLLCIASSALLWFAYPSTNSVTFTLTCIVIGTIGLEVAIVFYNAFLPAIAPTNYIGRISGWAWGLGYFGGIVALSIALYGFIKAQPTWLDIHTAAQVRICGPLTAIWFFIFAIPLFCIVPETPLSGLSFKKAIHRGLNDLGRTLKSLPKHPNLVLFLLAHLIYQDGLNTLFAFGGIYAAGTFNMDLASVILFGITMNLSAGIGAIGLAWVDDFFGSKLTILLSLGGLILFGIPILIVHQASYFWTLGLLVSLFIGPTQAASRSLMARIVPPSRATELFGLYAFSGKITAFIGPALLGLATEYYQSQRVGMTTVILFFIIGAILMHYVQEKPMNVGTKAD